MNQEEIKNVLTSVKAIIENLNAYKSQRDKEGNNFDIFEELDFFTRHEEQLHTPFLAMLLNPNGAHGVKDEFLKAFLEDVVKEKFELNTTEASVAIEMPIGNVDIKENGESEGGKIDIFIKDKEKNAIIIENKFNRYGDSAQDQPKQLERYYNYVKGNNFKLLYLTPDGHYPSFDSVGKLKENDYICISYSKDIEAWLKHCISIAESHSCEFVAATIKQYINYINNKMSIMDNELSKKIENILSLHGKNVIEDIRNLDDFIAKFKKTENALIDFKVRLAKKFDNDELGLKLKNAFKLEKIPCRAWNGTSGWKFQQI